MRILPFICSAVAAATPAALVAPVTASAAVRANCTIEITGGRVAIRTDSDPASAVARVVSRGTRLVNSGCYTIVGRGDGYDKCGQRGWDWYVVREGYVPLTCARRA